MPYRKNLLQANLTLFFDDKSNRRSNNVFMFTLDFQTFSAKILIEKTFTMVNKLQDSPHIIMLCSCRGHFGH